MKLKNNHGDILELPHPNDLGEGVVLLNGKVIERVLYSDEYGGSVTLGNGRRMRPGDAFAQYLINLLDDIARKQA